MGLKHLYHLEDQCILSVLSIQSDLLIRRIPSVPWILVDRENPVVQSVLYYLMVRMVLLHQLLQCTP